MCQKLEQLTQIFVIKVISDLIAIGWWFSAGTPVSSTNKTDCHITEILLKVALNTIHQPHTFSHLLLNQ